MYQESKTHTHTSPVTLSQYHAFNSTCVLFWFLYLLPCLNSQITMPCQNCLSYQEINIPGELIPNTDAEAESKHFHLRDELGWREPVVMTKRVNAAERML